MSFSLLASHSRTNFSSPSRVAKKMSSMPDGQHTLQQAKKVLTAHKSKFLRGKEKSRSGTRRRRLNFRVVVNVAHTAHHYAYDRQIVQKPDNTYSQKRQACGTQAQAWQDLRSRDDRISLSELSKFDNQSSVQHCERWTVSPAQLWVRGGRRKFSLDIEREQCRDGIRGAAVCKYAYAWRQRVLIVAMTIENGDRSFLRLRHLLGLNRGWRSLHFSEALLGCRLRTPWSWRKLFSTPSVNKLYELSVMYS